MSPALAADANLVAPFSPSRPGGPLPAGWREQGMPLHKAPQISLVADEGVTVLRVHAVDAAGAALHPVGADPNAGPRLSWRWKIDHVVEKANLEERSGDDFAARVYVFFDVPIAELTLPQRLKLRLARAVSGDDVPSAGICYVWDNRHPVGTVSGNPYGARIHTFVLESGNGFAGLWRNETRDLAADFRTAFGAKAVPRVTGIAVGNDSDQTGDTVTAWFGDVKLEARR
jgi:hypothetical protein